MKRLIVAAIVALSLFATVSTASANEETQWCPYNVSMAIECETIYATELPPGAVGTFDVYRTANGQSFALSCAGINSYQRVCVIGERLNVPNPQPYPSFTG